MEFGRQISQIRADCSRGERALAVVGAAMQVHRQLGHHN
jgi:hypothetical protein